MEQVVENLIKKPNKSRFEELAILDDPDSKKRIIELKNDGNGRSWGDVAKLFNSEHNTSLSNRTVENVYNEEIALEITISGNKEKLFSDNLDQVKKRYKRVSQTIDKYQKVVDDTVNEMADVESVELLRKTDDILRVGKQVEVIHKMVEKQISLLLAEQEKVMIKAEKNKKTMSPQEVMRKIKEYLPEQLRSLERQGKLKIIDSNLLK